jgi:hypothetical protein
LRKDATEASRIAQESLARLQDGLKCAKETGKLECCALCKEQAECKRWLFGNHLQAPVDPPQALCWLNYVLVELKAERDKPAEPAQAFDEAGIKKLVTVELQLRRSAKLAEIQQSKDASERLLTHRSTGGLVPSELLMFILCDAGTDYDLRTPLYHYR